MRAPLDCVSGSNLYKPCMDFELEQRIANFLYQRRVPHCGSVRLNAQSGTVVVTGKLRSRRAKWLCLECCRRVAGVIEVVDQVRVGAARNKPKRKAETVGARYCELS